MSIDHSTLPSIRNASLPVKYEAAKLAIAECHRLDECKDWADKSAALASYAKQSDDKTMEHTAMRIRSRAVRRCGELLEEFEKAKGGQPFQKNSTGARADTSRKQVATDAGLSAKLAVTAIRVARVPSDSFEAQVESDEPPTITALAEQGKRPANVIPDYVQLGMTLKAFQAGMHFGGAIRRYVEAMNKYDPQDVADGLLPKERDEIRSKLNLIAEYNDRLMPKI